MLKPNFVGKGDKIAIVSTARKITRREIKEATDILKRWGLVPVIGATIDIENDQFAGTDEQRKDDFQKMLDDPEIKAIWCARGGYGTVRIIDSLDFTKFQKYPKWIIGYSDITVIHSHVNNLGVSSIHAAMPVDIFKSTEEAKQSLCNTLFGTRFNYRIPSTPINKIGKSHGQLVGGNLSMLYSICGSVSSLDCTNKILCIEDLDEYLYHMDRMLQNLKRNGYFDKLSGLIVGGMIKMHDNNIPFGKNVEEIILDIVAAYDFPVVFNFPMGHIEDNRALILGAEVSLEVSEDEVILEYV